MVKKKKAILAVEMLEINSTWDYRGRKIFNNFICNQENAESAMIDMDIKETWKHEKGYSDELKGILAERGTRNASETFFGDDVCVEEVKLPASIKPSTKYIYKIYDYAGDKLNVEYGAQKDAMAYISKKIKTKYAYVSYNGIGEKIEYSPKTVTDILDELESTTSQFEIEPVGRGDADEIIIVSIFKNCIK